MTEKITLELTLEELKLIDKYVELNDDTQQLFDKIRDAYPKSKTLTDIVTRWWCDVFTSKKYDWSMETSIEDLVDRIELFLPREQSANSQNAYVECSVEGFNDCLKKIKSKLR